MSVTTNRSANGHSLGTDGAPFVFAPEHQIDGCRDAVTMRSSMPQRGRLDVVDRSVVVTARMGEAMVLQRLPLNAYKGVAAQLAMEGEETIVTLVLRHDDPAYAITLEEALPLDDAVAVWRAWADRLSVPLLLNETHGEDSVVRAMLGAVVLRTTQPRRTNTLANRRPRFSKRRGRR